MISVEKINYHYPGYSKILRDVSFKLEAGNFLAILGNNGVGKSTLLKCLNRILIADSGRVLLDGANLFQMSPRRLAKRVAYVSQGLPIMGMTVQDVVMLGRRPYMGWGFKGEDHDIVQKTMKRLELNECIHGRFVNRLSGGEQQKVMLARALAQEPQVLLLDEPTSSLDIRNQHQVLATIQNICKGDGIVCIMAIHDLNLALKFCNRFLLMRQGQVFAYGDHSILDSFVLKEIYDIDAKVVQIEGQYVVLVD